MTITRAAFGGLLLAAAVLLADNARASDLVLRGDIVVYAPVATVGDFYDNAGAHADRALFRSPDIGHRGTVPVSALEDRLSALGIQEADNRGLAAVDVTRASQYLTGETFLSMVTAALADRLGGARLEDLEVVPDALPAPVHADAGAAVPVTLRRLSYSARSARFEARFAVDDGRRQREILIRGAARETRRVVVLSRPIGRGEMIEEADIVEARVDARNLSERVAVSADQLIGMQARRNIRENAAISTADLSLPTLVERNQSVVIAYRTPTMVLSSQGRALASGAQNDLINVLNLQSNRVVQGRVTGAGEVLVSPRTLRLAKRKE